MSDQTLRFFVELDLLHLSQILNEKIFLWFSNFWINFFSAVHGCGYKFLRDSSGRLMVPNMILLLGFVDLVDHAASSISTQLVTFSSVFARTRGFFYMSLSQCKL